jgi:DNA-3-methyladenine glycosylase
MLPTGFFDQDAQQLAQALLGKVICVKHHDLWLKAMIVETEAYYLIDKASHSSLGFTAKRRALFMDPGTIYMYYAHGKSSLNISARGEGNAVLIKAGIPHQWQSDPSMLQAMHALNSPLTRAPEKLCAGQTLLCRSLNLKVTDWDQKNFDPERFYFQDVGYLARQIIQTTRLGIPQHRDPHLLYRFIDFDYAHACTNNPLNKRVKPPFNIITIGENLS